jgi:hypothetical protein
LNFFQSNKFLENESVLRQNCRQDFRGNTGPYSATGVKWYVVGVSKIAKRKQDALCIAESQRLNIAAITRMCQSKSVLAEM